MTVRNIARATAWFTLMAIIVLSLVPPGIRPTTFMSHKIEHASIFLLNGVAFGIAYCGYSWLSSIMAVIFCAGIELGSADDSRSTCARQRFFCGCDCDLLRHFRGLDADSDEITPRSDITSRPAK